MLGERKAAILRELVEAYIQTGEPVSSRAIVECGLDCSSATVRNELAVLEAEGYIAKPHTSAGRIPTDRGYRYYLDHLLPGSLRRSTQARIIRFFSSMHTELGRMLQQTSELLSEITHYPAVVVGPGLRGQRVHDVHLIPIGPREVLLVVVAGTGTVNQALLRLSAPAAPDEVARAGEALAERMVGKVLDGSPVEPADPDGLPPVGLDVVQRALGALDSVAAEHREIYLGGAAWMATLWEDLAKLQRILGVLDREAGMVGLLGGDDDGHGLSVRFGTELPAGEDDLAVVSSSYDAAGGSGRMGVFGPLRMDYRRTIRVVEEVSEALGDSLGG